MAQLPPPLRESNMRYLERGHSSNKISDSDYTTRQGKQTAQFELDQEMDQMVGEDVEDNYRCAGTDADEEDNDDEEIADVLAPPAHTSNITGSQAGSVHGLKALRGGMVGQKRRRQPESSDEETITTRVKPTRAKRELDQAKTKSDDEDYTGVDLISDSEEIDCTLEQIEEKIIIDSEEEYGAFSTSNPFFLSDLGGLDAMDDELSISNFFLLEEQTHKLGHTESDTVVEPTAVSDEPSRPIPPPRRRVRFADILESASEGSAIKSGNEVTTFPDLFLEQTHLDPAFRQAIEYSDGTPGAVFNPYAGWDGMQGSFGLHVDLEEEEDSQSSCGSSSDYETDPGETTEEDEMLSQIIARPEQLVRPTSSSSAEPTMPSASTSVGKIRTGSASRYGPTMGSWVADPTKPIAVIDCTGKGMIIIPALRPHKVDRMFEQISSASATADNSPHPSFSRLADGVDDSENDRSDIALLESGSGVIVPQQIHNSPKSTDEDDEDDDDGEAALNVNDFIDFGDEASDSDGYMDSNTQALPSAFLPLKNRYSAFRAPVLDSGVGSSIQQDFHIDTNQVSAFRRNQERHRALLSRPLVHASIQGGRNAAAYSPPSPLRKRNLSNAGSLQRIGKSKDRSLASSNVAKRRVVHNNNNHYHS